MNIKEIVKDNTVQFVRYRKNIAYYSISVNGETYVFPVDTFDIGDATLEASDKAIYFMRYIRMSLDEGTFIKET